VTAEQRARQAAMQAAAASEAANAAKSTFLATMSHEIRTPLNGVLGMVQVMAADQPTDRQAWQLEVIRSSGESLLAILNDVLDFSKIEAGKLDLEDIEFDLAEVLSGVEASFSAVAAHKGLALMWDSAEADGRYRGDPIRLRQILCNLVSNALKFTSCGEVRLSASYDGELQLEVTDTGIGIAPDALQKLFAPFVQADAGMSREYGGTGLGLSIAKRLAEMMGGWIGASSVVGAGSRFQVTLPLERLGAGAAPAKAAREEPQTTQFEGLNILLAEDNPTNQLVISTLLQQVGCEVSVASNGAEAVEARRSGAFDLILMDVQMPGMDGPSATRFIRAEEVATGEPPIPIVGLTANAMAHQIAEYEACGMDQVVTKPIVLSHLLEAIQGSIAATSAVTSKSARRDRAGEIKAPRRA
jgi:two-component system, sensor histidine kinase